MNESNLGYSLQPLLDKSQVSQSESQSLTHHDHHDDAHHLPCTAHFHQHSKHAEDVIRCSFCRQVCVHPWFKCLQDSCRDVYVCNNCSTRPGMSHKLIGGHLEVHTNYNCDGCGTGPIIGIRYKCIQKECTYNKDYCQACFDSKIHSSNHKLELSFKGLSQAEQDLVARIAQNDSQISQQEADRYNSLAEKIKECGYCKILIPGPQYVCTYRECSEKTYCQKCADKKLHETKHILVDVNNIDEDCLRCGEKPRTENYTCIQCNFASSCDVCAKKEDCYYGHPMLPKSLVKDILNSEFAKLIKSSKDFAKEIWELVKKDYEDRKAKFAEWEKSKSDEKRSDHADYEFSNSWVVRYVKEDANQRESDYNQSPAPFLIREVIFNISPSTFAKIQAMNDYEFDFKMLFVFKFYSAMAIMRLPTDNQHFWGGFRFEKSYTFEHYLKDELMKVHFTIGEAHLPVIRRFDAYVHAPSFMCFMHLRLGEFVDHIWTSQSEWT